MYTVKHAHLCWTQSNPTGEDTLITYDTKEEAELDIWDFIKGVKESIADGRAIHPDMKPYEREEFEICALDSPSYEGGV